MRQLGAAQRRRRGLLAGFEALVRGQKPVQFLVLVEHHEVFGLRHGFEYGADGRLDIVEVERLTSSVEVARELLNTLGGGIVSAVDVRALQHHRHRAAASELGYQAPHVVHRREHQAAVGRYHEIFHTVLRLQRVRSKKLR